MSRSRWFARCYRAALLIFPRDFRARFGDEMLLFARQRIERARSRGRLAAAREVCALTVDVAKGAAREWTSRAPSPAIDVHIPADRPRDSMDILVRDVRFAVRSLLRRPGFTVVASLTLALAIGANTAVFSVVNATLIRALPYPDPDRLVMVWGTQGTQQGQGVVYADYLDWRARARSFSEMGVFRGQSVNLTGNDTPERLVGNFVSASFLRAIGAKAYRGRLFADDETDVATKQPVAVLSYECWQSRFGASASTLGGTVTINDVPFRVVGITTPNMQSPLFTADVLLPIGYYPNAHGFDRGTRGVLVAARLAPGVTIQSAQREMSAIGKQLADAYPATNASTGAEVEPLKETLVGRVRDRLLIMLGAVVVVLLIACANVANLQLARGASRVRELSVRAALGAGRGRIAQQLITENLVLSLVGGGAGLALGAGLLKALVALIGPQLPVDASAVTLDRAVLGFIVAVTIGTGLLFGVAPAWQASRMTVHDALRSRARGIASTRIRNALAVTQLALSLMLLASAGLLTRSLLALERVNPGFDASHVLTAQFRLPAATYGSPEKIWTMFDRAIQEIRAIPGVESAALVRASPLSGNGESFSAVIEGRPAVAAGDAPQVQLNVVTPGYFSTMRIPLRTGRDVAPTDRLGAEPVVVVNESFANAMWPKQPALGKRIKVGNDEWLTVVGVVGDTKHFTLNETQLFQGYVPHAQRPQVFTSVVARTRGDPLALAKGLREAIWRVDRNQPVWRVQPLDNDVDAVVTSSKTTMWLTGLFALVSLLVATVGIYGVLSYTMTQRTQEIGVRVALGADSRRVVTMVVGEAAQLVAWALGIGLVVSWIAGRLLRGELYGVGSNDVATFATVSIVLAAVALVACYVPARRASRVDPTVALRAE